MPEIELKFQVPPDRLRALDAALAGPAPAARQRLQASYFDTDDRALATARLALRLRREGRRWVQTLKGASADGMARFEHELPRGAAAAMPALEPALHAGTPSGDRLLALLATRPSGALQPRFRTDVLRRTRVVHTPHGRVELALDVGRIDAGERTLALHEFEIELVDGSPLAVLAAARDWPPRHGLWLDTRSKAERGDLLARGEAMAPPAHAAKLRLGRGFDAHAAWQAVLGSCTAQILANAGQVAAGEHTAEHVHQLRVGLRRLRSAVDLFDGLGAEAALADAAAVLFRGLGAARDRALVDAEFGAPLRDAIGRAGLAAAFDGAPSVASAGAASSADEAPAASSECDDAAVSAVRGPASQALFLALIAARTASVAIDVAGNAAGDAAALRRGLARRLKRWHRRTVADAERFDELDDAGRHVLRKRIKRLRYAAEFFAALHGGRRVKRFLEPLRALQERLGAISDALAATRAFEARRTEAQAMFALGWLAARRDMLIEAAAPALRNFIKARPFWDER